MEAKKIHVRKEVKSKLKLRKKIKKKKPEFKRQEQWRYKRLKKGWRKPKGIDSKLKKGKKSRGKTVRPGYSSPISVRGLTKSGHKIVRIHNVKDVDKIQHANEVGLIASGIGAKKRAEIIKYAEEKNVHIMNKTF
ncbi:MAG: 50S ribosomal protein L32e [Nanoarchaeota archaeon]